MREKAVRTKAARLAEQRATFIARKADEAASEKKRRDEAQRRADEDEVKERAKLKAASEAKKRTKLEKKARKKAPSAFALQAEQEAREAAAEIEATQKAADLLVQGFLQVVDGSWASSGHIEPYTVVGVPLK